MEYWSVLYSGKDVGNLICNVGSGVAAGGAAAAGGGDATDAGKDEKPVETKKEESDEESDEDMGFGEYKNRSYLPDSNFDRLFK